MKKFRGKMGKNFIVKIVTMLHALKKAIIKTHLLTAKHQVTKR
jgi:hypothetical protein